MNRFEKSPLRATRGKDESLSLFHVLAISLGLSSVHFKKSGIRTNVNLMGILDFFKKKKISVREQTNGFTIPKGWTTVKIDDNHYQHHISPEIQVKWAAERRKKDKVLSLIQKDGVHLRSRGRGGTIYVVNNGKIAEVDFELGSNGLILGFENITHWSLPNEINLSSPEKQLIKESLIDWSIKTNTTISF